MVVGVAEWIPRWGECMEQLKLLYGINQNKFTLDRLSPCFFLQNFNKNAIFDDFLNVLKYFTNTIYTHLRNH